jgi:hypothetical protein
MLDAEENHRDHAIIEQVNADLYAGPLAHFPSGAFNANAAWPTLAAITFNLLRAAGTLAGPRLAKAWTATVRRDLIAIPARTARHGRGKITFHLPEGWHREHEWTAFADTARLYGKGLTFEFADTSRRDTFLRHLSGRGRRAGERGRGCPGTDRFSTPAAGHARM